MPDKLRRWRDLPPDRVAEPWELPPGTDQDFVMDVARDYHIPWHEWPGIDVVARAEMLAREMYRNLVTMYEAAMREKDARQAQPGGGPTAGGAEAMKRRLRGK